MAKKTHEKADDNLREFVVGDRIKVNIDATIKAVIDRTDGQRLQVDFGKDETALIHFWQVVERIR